MSGLRDQLQSIYDQYGELVPRTIVELAVPKDHPLHSYFEWDNKIAGPKYRELQAERLIRSVRVAYKDKRGHAQQVRWWHPVRSDPGVYDPLDVIAQDPISMEILLRQAEREWKAMKNRYGHLAAFWEIVRKDAVA